jgi:hypothetical protein
MSSAFERLVKHAHASILLLAMGTEFSAKCMVPTPAALVM